jgi:hypothetical protein
VAKKRGVCDIVGGNLHEITMEKDGLREGNDAVKRIKFMLILVILKAGRI